MKSTLENRIGLLRRDMDKIPYIVPNKDQCQSCDTRPCVAGCPARCYIIESEKLHFRYENCIECETCEVVCSRDAADLNYPRGTFAASYKPS